ncbi:DNA-binding response regulator [Hyphomonas neptunium ATCC 15444]|uniref:DNA-binding response regulator n=2 Tax=Hyphomonas TaxID=85 RepID=Q0BXH5_HYPNA|nr:MULTISPECIES: response regulator transcription factor [Hyphomonas]ABI77914.1 DNA-binding response regulator [Hyphomonas neptunium ATCC 15444]KCZ89927.1 DNA-binding response regulator [Hyphomonas hirschiana VP5]
MRIVLIDDDRMVLETITLGWPDPADKFDTFESFEALKPFLYSADFQSVSCVILDLQLPDASGSQVLAEIRRLSDVPIIMLSGWGDADFRADIINRGIDDYVLKPASSKELHARASRLTRKASAQPLADLPAILTIGNVEYLQEDRALRRAGQVIELTHAEASLLDALAVAGGKPVSRNDLYFQSFGRPYKDGEKVLETYISRLRHKLEELEAGTGHALQTARGVGYRLVARAV